MKHISPLKMARIKSGYSVQDAARFLSIHKTTLQRYERGDCPVPQNLLPAISKLYHISPSSLFGLSETEYLFKKGFYIFYWQPPRASPHPEILSYMEAFSPAQQSKIINTVGFLLISVTPIICRSLQFFQSQVLSWRRLPVRRQYPAAQTVPERWMQTRFRRTESGSPEQ